MRPHLWLMLLKFVELSKPRRWPERRESFTGVMVSNVYRGLLSAVTLKESRMKNGLAEL